MKQNCTFAVLVLSLNALSGCVNDQEENETALGRAPNALENDNALDVNALNVNALNVNALNVNALSANALAAIQDSGPNGTLARQLLEYTVSCALNDMQTFSFSWIDAIEVLHNEHYQGHLALEPSWSTGPLSASGARWVSACLASRVNYYGEHVIISSRGSISVLSGPGATEQSGYQMLEGAFWGNLYTDPPELYACHYATNDAHSRSKLRDCAAGHIVNSVPQDCGIIHIVGTCDTACQTINAEGTFYPSCRPDSGAAWTDQVITVFLP